MLYPILELAWPLYLPVDLSSRWCKLNFEPWYGSGELLDKTFKQQVCFSYCLIFLSLTTSHRLKKKIIFDSEILIIETCYSLSKWHLAVQICAAGYVEYYVGNLEKRFTEKKFFFCRPWFLLEKIRRCFTFKSNLNIKSLGQNFNLYFEGTLMQI